MTIADKLLAANAAKQSIKTALEGKGVDTSTLPFTDYGAAVANLSVGGGGGPTVTATRNVKLAGAAAAGDTVVETEVVEYSGGLELLTTGWQNVGLDQTYSQIFDDTLRTGFIAALTPDASILVIMCVQSSPATIHRYQWNASTGVYEHIGSGTSAINNHSAACSLCVSNDGSKVVLGIEDNASKTLLSFTWNGSAYVEDPDVTNGNVGRIYKVAMMGNGDRLLVVGQSSPYLHWFYWDTDRYVRGTQIAGVTRAGAKHADLSEDGLRGRAVVDYYTPSTLEWTGTTYAKVGTFPVIDPDGYPTSSGGVAFSAMSRDGLRLFLGINNEMRYYNWSEGDLAFVRGNDVDMVPAESDVVHVRFAADGLSAVAVIDTTPNAVPLVWSEVNERFEEDISITPAVPSYNNGRDTAYVGAALVFQTSPYDALRIYRRSDTQVTRYASPLTSPTSLPAGPKSIGWLDAGGAADEAVTMTAIWWADFGVFTGVPSPFASLWMGGEFYAIDGVSTAKLAKFVGDTPTVIPSGPDNVVWSAVEFNGKLYFGGLFTNVGGVARPSIASWNGTSYAALGSGVSGAGDFVRDIAVFNDQLYVGGSFLLAGGLAANSLARWNGTSWGIPAIIDLGEIQKFHVFEGNLYIATTSSQIARYNGTALTALWTLYAFGPIDSFAEFNGELYAGSASHLLKFTGSGWVSVASATSSTPRPLCAHNGKLIVGLSSGISTFGGADATGGILAYDGTDFTPLASAPLTSTSGTARVLTAVSRNGKLYVGGKFSSFSGLTTSHLAILELDNMTWVASGVNIQYAAHGVHCFVETDL